jgi:DNA-binding LytR/AlgR family response regulator
MKLNIAICDDEKSQRDYLTVLVSKWAASEGLTCAASTYDSAEAYLFSREDANPADILLLDVQMKALDGVALAKKLRQADERVQIIFITGYPDYMAEGYEVSALHYLLKPVDEQKLRETLDRAVRLLSEKPRVITIQTGGGVVSVRADGIYYAEVFSHHVELHTEAETYRLSMSMKELEKLLGEGFFRCHRSYIAGLAHVRRVTRTAMLLDSGKELPLSRGLYDAANQAFIRFN